MNAQQRGLPVPCTLGRAEGNLGPWDVKGRVGQSEQTSSFWSVLSLFLPLRKDRAVALGLKTWASHSVGPPQSMGTLTALVPDWEKPSADWKWHPPND